MAIQAVELGVLIRRKDWLPSTSVRPILQLNAGRLELTMANGKQAAAKRLKMAERARQQKELHFPNVHEDWLWHRNRNDGYTTIPRTMPIIMEMVDVLTKGTPAGQTLLTLWCRSPDHALVTIESPAVMATEAGFSGERAVDTWRRRMKKLQELHFIMTKKGAAGDFHYVLLLHPHWVIEQLRTAGVGVPESIYGRFIERLMEVGAFGEIEIIRGHQARWAAEAAAAAAQVPAPPPPPPEGPGEPSSEQDACPGTAAAAQV